MKKAGFSLLEVLVSCLVSIILLVAVFTVVGMATDGYDHVRQSLQTGAEGCAGTDLINADLERIALDLPICLASGKSARGWYYVNGGYGEWRAGSATRFPSEEGVASPSDRLGFFIHLSEEEAERYGGHTVAHVLYFRAFSGKLKEHRLNPGNPSADQRSTPRLYRVFTPPDRVHQRLKLLNVEHGRGDSALPKGPAYLSGEVVADDAGWGLEGGRATLSVISSEVASFSVQIHGREIMQSGYGALIDLTEVEALEVPGGQSAHALLEANSVRLPRVEVMEIGVKIVRCPPQTAARLKVADWRNPKREVSLQFSEERVIKKVN